MATTKVTHAGAVIRFTAEDDTGDEREFTLPSKREVCDRCEGHGTHLTPSIGEHAYSAEEFAEAFDDDEEREDYFRRGGRYDVTCEECKGERVVDVVDYERAEREAPEALRVYEQQQQWEANYRAECAAERRMGA